MHNNQESYAVITGASSGIGAQFACKLAKEGYRLVLAARRRDRLEELAQKLCRQYRLDKADIVIVEVDLAKEEDCRYLMKMLEDKEIGVFINCAGFGVCGDFLHTDLEAELSMLAVNVKAVHILTKLVLYRMNGQGRGYLLNVASSAGLVPAGPYMAAYYAGKSYVASLTRSIAQELKEQQSAVYIGALCPGPVNTAFNAVAQASSGAPGISAKTCVDYAWKQMKKRRTVIVPSWTMRAGLWLGKCIPQCIYIRMNSRIQKRKLRHRI